MNMPSLETALGHGPDSDSPVATLTEITRLCDLGYFLQAAALFPQVDAAATPDLLIQRARAMRNLGNDRGCDALIIRLWRKHPDHDDVRVNYLRLLGSRRGTHDALQFMQRYPMPDSALPSMRAEWLSARSMLMARLRDFEASREAFAQACAIKDDEPWLWVERGYACEMEDRYAEALEHVDRALAMLPGYRPALQYRQHLLRISGREAESLAELEDAFARLECAPLGVQLFDILYDHGDYLRAAAVLDRLESMWRDPDKFSRTWIAARRCDIAMRHGDVGQAMALAKLAGGKFYTPIAERLATASDTGRQVLLPVQFTRQHWATCAPATLSSLCAYWGHAAEHLEIAEEICYDGTPYHSERQWAEKAGMITREFTLDWASACALIDAGVPFTLSTTHTGGGHLQAVVGYDTMRNSLLIRDPFSPSTGEFEFASLLRVNAATGPRGMLLLPPHEASRLDGISLPDELLWNDYHQLMAALARYDRDTAAAALARQEAVAPDHRLTLVGRRSLAIYDGDENAILRATEALLLHFPDDTNLQLSKATSLRVVGGSDAHLAWLASLALKPNPDAVVLGRYVARLAEDGRRRNEAFRICRQALRYAPSDSSLWLQMGSLLWDAGRLQDAEPYYRAAACLAFADEGTAECYLRTCRLVRQTERGLNLLRQRTRTLGKLSAAPWRTLVEQLDQLARSEEAFAVLDEALQLHPEDGDLLPFAAEQYICNGMIDKAGPLLDRSPTAARRDEWLRVSALLAENQGRHDEAIAFVRQASEASPLNLRHHRTMASMLMRLQGRSAVLDWLRAACARFPLNYALNRLLYEWIDGADPDACEAQLRTLLASHPEDVWTLRELAWHLVRQLRYDDGLKFAEEALQRSPEQSHSHSTMAAIRLRQHGYAAAVPHLRQAITLDIDNDYAVSVYVEQAPTLEMRRDALAHVRAELVRQVTIGDGLLSFQSSAQQVIPAEELLATLREALAERPDLWHAWIAVATQLSDMGRAEESLAVLDDAALRFPVLARLYVEQARAWVFRGDRKQAYQCVERALAIAPAWNRAVRLAVDIVYDEGVAPERAEQVLRRALALAPNDADLRGLLGWQLEHMQRYEEALDCVRESLRQDPTADWVWNAARRLLDQLNQREQLDSMLQEAVAARPGDIGAWRMQAEHSDDPATALGAAVKATELDPLNVRNWETRLNLLLKQKRLDEIGPLLDALPLPPPMPTRLAAFRARVLRQQEQNDAAREALRALLANEETDYGLWHELADWYDTDQIYPEYVEASQVLLRIAPTNSNAHGYLGDALIKAGRQTEAVATLRRALELYPGYYFAALKLCDLAIESGDADTVAFALDTIRPHSTDAPFAQREIELAGMRGDLAMAHAALERLACHKAATTELMDAALHVINKQGWTQSCAGLLSGLIQEGRCKRVAARAWMQMLPADKEKAGSQRKFVRAVIDAARAEAGTALRREIVSHSAEEKDYALLNSAVGELRTRLREDDFCWGHVGWALTTFNRYQEAANWLADWRDREKLPHWMAYNIALSNANLDQFEESGAAAAASLKQDPEDTDLRIWLALDAAIRGEYQLLTTQLKNLDPAKIYKDLQPVADMLNAFLEAVLANDSSLAHEAFRATRPFKEGRPYLVNACRRLAWRLVLKHTPVWKMPWRWLALDGG